MISNSKIDNIIDGMHSLMDAESWDVLEFIFEQLTLCAWRIDIAELASYIIPCFVVKNHIACWDRLIDKCKELHPEENFWKEDV